MAVSCLSSCSFKSISSASEPTSGSTSSNTPFGPDPLTPPAPELLTHRPLGQPAVLGYPLALHWCLFSVVSTASLTRSAQEQPKKCGVFRGPLLITQTPAVHTAKGITGTGLALHISKIVSGPHRRSGERETKTPKYLCHWERQGGTEKGSPRAARRPSS